MSQSAPTAAPAASSQPGASLLPDSTHLFTVANFAIIAVLALLVVLGLIYGARLHRRRREATREVHAHNAALADEDRSDPAVVPVAPPPVVPPLPDPTPPDPTLPDPTPPDPTPPDPAPLDPAPLADEPIAAATPALAENPAAAAAPPAPAAPTAAASGPDPAAGPVTQLKGVGPRVAERLAQHGITTVGQLAALTDDEAQALDAQLGPFTGRMGRDRWQEQARFLAAGDQAGFEAVFGRL